MNARVAKLEAPRQLVWREEPLQRAENELLAETLYSAISVGTELAAYRGDPPLRPGPVYPRLVGYCNVARVRAGPHAGEHILTHQSHRSAFVCSADKILAIIPEGTDLVAAATTYLFQLGYNALRTGGFEPGQRVAVIGLGTLGLATVALVKALGGEVTAFSQRDSGLARDLGATEHAGDFGLVVTTSGSWEDWKLALQRAARGGTICVLGFPGRTQPRPDFNPLDSQYFYDKQLRILAAGAGPNASALLLEKIRRGELPARRLIGGVAPWNKLGELYEQFLSGDQQRLTWVLQW